MGRQICPLLTVRALRNLSLRRAKTILRCCIFDTRKRTIVPKVGISRRASFLRHGPAKATVSIENLRDESIIMHYSETLPLHDRYHDRDLDPVDLDDGPSRPRHTESMAFGSKPARFRSDNASISRRIMRKLARYLFAVLIGVAGTLAWQSHEAVAMLRTWAPSLGWLLPTSATRAPAPVVTSVELQQQLKPMMVELAITRRSIEQLAANQDQSARKQEQLVQAINTLQAAEQDVSQKISNLPSQKAARVQPVKPVPPDAQ